MKKGDMPKEKKTKIRKAMLIGIALAIFIIYVIPEKKKETKPQDPVLELMDRTLDSLIKTKGIEEYELTSKGEKEEYNELLQYDEEDSLYVINMRIQMVQTLPKINDKEKIKRLEGLVARRDSLEAVLNVKKSIPDEIKIASRRIRLKTPDGKEYAFFQQHKLGKITIKYFIETTSEDIKRPETDF